MNDQTPPKPDLMQPRDALSDSVDYSSVEAQAAVQAAAQIVLEIREHTMAPLARKVRLYERTLGLAVVPVLLRRLVIRLAASRRAGRVR